MWVFKTKKSEKQKKGKKLFEIDVFFFFLRDKIQFTQIKNFKIKNKENKISHEI